MNLFSLVKQQLSMLAVANEYTALKKAGLYWKGTCPFHVEKTASFTVSPHKEIFYCFGCNTGGDIITFIAKIENCTPVEAIKLLIDRYKLSIPEELLKQSHNPQSTAERNHYFDLCKIIAEWAHRQLLTHYKALEYVTNRSITKESIDYFSIGYFPGGPQAITKLVNHIQKHHFLVNDLLEAHILFQGKNVLYSPFEERIIFPIKDHLGRFCGFGGRIYKPTDERAKYYNSRENNHFAKGSLLFGLDKAKQTIQKNQIVFLVEGYTDCVAMVQAGFPNTVATLGTACTIEHLTLLARYTSHIYVLYDGDRAGQEAILRLTQLCWQVNVELKVVCLPAQEDPASFLHKKNNLTPLLEKAMDIFDFFIHSMGRNFNTKSLHEKLQLTQKILVLIEKIEDPLKRDLLLQKAAKTLDIPFASLQNSLRYQKPRQTTAPPLPASQPVLASQEWPALEKKIFIAIMQNIQLLNRDNEQYIIEYMPEFLGNILKKILIQKDINPSLDFTQFFDILTIDEQQYVSKMLLEEENNASEKEFDLLLAQLQKKHWKLIVHSTKIKLAQAEQQNDAATIEKVLNDFLQLKKKMLHKNLI